MSRYSVARYGDLYSPPWMDDDDVEAAEEARAEAMAERDDDDSWADE